MDQFDTEFSPLVQRLYITKETDRRRSSKTNQASEVHVQLDRNRISAETKDEQMTRSLDGRTDGKKAE